MTALLTRRAALSLLTFGMAMPALAQRGREPEVPYVPTPPELVEHMLDLAQLSASDHLIDLGCGDGRIAVAAARRGARALGVDIDPERIRQAVAHALIAGVEGRARFRREDLFATPIHDADVIALYLLPAVNLRLRPRLLTELRAGSRVVSHAFDMGDWAPDEAQEHDGRRIFLWHVPAVAGGSWEVAMGDGVYRLLEIEQRFQEVSGTVTAGGTVTAVSGRLRGTSLTLGSSDGSLRLDGRVEGDRIVAADGAWQAVRLA